MKKKGLIISLGVLVVLLVGALIVYNVFLTSPAKIFETTFDNFYKEFKSGIEDSETISSDKMSFTFDGSIDSNMEELLGLKDYKFKLDGRMDLESSNSEFDFGILKNNNDLLSGSIFLNEDGEFLTLKDVTTKVIALNLYESFDDEFNLDYGVEDLNFNLDMDDIDYVLKTFLKSLTSNMIKTDFSNEEVTIKVNGERLKTNKITYVMTNKYYEKVADTLTKDKKLVEILAGLTGVSKAEMINDIEDGLTNVESDGEMIVYTYGALNEVIKFAILEDETEISITNYEDILTIGLSIEGIPINITITEVSDTETDIVVSMMGLDIVKLDYKKISDEHFKLGYVIEIEGEVINGELEVSQEKNSKDKYSGVINFSFNYLDSYLDETKLSFKSNYTVELDAKMTDIDTSNAIEFEGLTQEELSILESKINSIDFLKDYLVE